MEWVGDGLWNSIGGALNASTFTEKASGQKTEKWVSMGCALYCAQHPVGKPKIGLS